MTAQQGKFLAVERFVREVLSKDLKQKVSPTVLRDVAVKVSKAIPSQEPKKKAR